MSFFIKIKRLIWLAPLLLVSSCSLTGSEKDKAPECILSKIQFDENNSLNFQTISGGRIYTLTQELTVDGETSITTSFQFNYFKDSISVVNQQNPNSLKPYMNVELKNDQPVEVIRNFNSVGVTLIHDISYPSENRIRVDLTREASTGDVLYVGYSDYELDENGNVVRNQQFRADSDEPSGFFSIMDRSYTYDDNPNPQDGLYLPFFANVSFPDLRFFIANNVQSYTEDGRTFTYQYDYGPNGEVIRQTLPTGVVLLFSYVNCPQ